LHLLREALSEERGRAVSRWFWCVEHHSNRSAAALRENREYPRRIPFLLWLRHQAAG